MIERLLAFQKIFGLTYRGSGLNAKENLLYLRENWTKLREKIEEFNSLLCTGIIIKVFANSLLLSTEFCLLADRINDSNNDLYIIIVLVSFMLCAAMDLLAICRSSRNIINSMESMIKATERRIAFTYLSPEDNKKVKLIVGMRTNFRFSASLNYDDTNDSQLRH